MTPSSTGFSKHRSNPLKSYGQNTLAVTLVSRPAGLEGGVTVEQLEILVEYNLPQGVEARPGFL